MGEHVTDSEIVAQIAHLADAVERSGIGRTHGSSANGNIVRLEGAGKFWHGLAIGITLGAAIAISAWVSSKMQQFEMRTQQEMAYKSAVYIVAPRLAEEIDKELDRQKERNNEHPDPDSDPAEKAEARTRSEGRG